MKKIYLPLLVFLFLPSFLLSSQEKVDPICRGIQKEIKRSMDSLRLENSVAPCFIDYMGNDLLALNVEAQLGSLVNSSEVNYVNSRSSVLVGSYEQNNLNVRTSLEELFGYFDYPRGFLVTDQEEVLRTEVWKVLDEKYKASVERYNSKQSLLRNTEVPIEERNIPDFQRLEQRICIYPKEPLNYDIRELEEYLKETSLVFADYPDIVDSNVRIYAGTSYVRYCNSENTVCCYPNNLVALFIYTKGRSVDGEDVVLTKSCYSSTIEELPSLDSLKALCKAQADYYQIRRTSETLDESYVGPVLFEGEAVADLVTQLLLSTENSLVAKRKPLLDEGLKMNLRYYSQMPAQALGNGLETFMNRKVISRDLTLTSMSGTEKYQGKRLFGYIPVDAQGVSPAKEMDLIKEGVLVNMLTSREPSKFFKESNGHMRVSPNLNYMGVYPGVLRLQSKRTMPESELKAKLLAAAKEEDYPYGYIIRKVNGDIPIEIYQVDVATGKEKLMRGGRILNLLLRSLKHVSGVSDKENVYNRIFQDVKSSYIVPSGLLLEEVEIVKDQRIEYKKPYIVDRPE